MTNLNAAGAPLRVGKFFTVSQQQFKKDGGMCDPSTVLLPRRMTAGSAGYDFFLPAPLSIPAGRAAVVPTAIRCKIAAGWVLVLLPKSGLGFKFGLRLANTAGVIDSDYFNAANEGHILIKIENTGSAPLNLAQGAAFAQGIFLPFGITEDDDAQEVRMGGLGSTSV